MSSEKTKRQSWVDFARGVAIILVLYRHVFEGIKSAGISTGHYMFLEHINIMLFSFRMPLFFIVSGIFLSASFAKRGLFRYIEVKARTILFPYFLWGALQITLQILFSDYVNSDRTSFDYLYLLYQPRNIEQFWYLYALFNVSVLYVVFKYVLGFKVWHQLLLGVGMFFLSAYFYRHAVNLGFVLDILTNYIFIAIGDMIHRTMRDPGNIRLFESPKITLALIVPFLASQFYFLMANLRHPEVIKYGYVEFYQPLAYLIISITGCAFVISCCFLLQRAGRPEWLRVLGTHSLHIYVAHVIAFASVRALIRFGLGTSNVPLLFITGIISGLLIPVFMYNVSKKINMDWIFGLKERELRKNVNRSIAIPEATIIQ